jgi:hypothetical protein
MLDDVLMNRLDQRVIGNGLNEDRAVVVLWRGSDINLYRQLTVLLQHVVMDILDALKPGHARVVDVVGLVIEDGQFIDLADDLAEVGLAVRRLADWLGPEGVEEVITQVVVFKRRLNYVPKIDAMDIGQEQIAGRTHHADIVLNVQRDLEIVAPVLAFEAVVWQHRIVEEDVQTIEIRAQAIQHNDVGRDQQDVA